MNDRNSTRSPGHSTECVPAQIDRLVSGDLPEPDRRSLLAWLDEDSRRWRACAMAFLEAQTWQQAAISIDQCDGERTPESTAASVRNEIRNSRNQETHYRLTHWVALATLLLAALAVGHLSGRSWHGASTAVPRIVRQPPISSGPHSQPLLATVAVRTNLEPGLPAQLTLPVSPADEQSVEPAMSDYDRKQWERRGFEVIEERRYLPATLPDGRQVMVPVSKVQLKFKGTPVS